MKCETPYYYICWTCDILWTRPELPSRWITDDVCGIRMEVFEQCPICGDMLSQVVMSSDHSGGGLSLEIVLGDELGAVTLKLERFDVNRCGGAAKIEKGG